MKGYIYILKRLGERFLKIGKTTKDPEIRAAEISAETGVSTPFLVVHAEEVFDIDSCEREVHSVLKEFRVNPRREFFDVSVKEALKKMDEVFEKFKEKSWEYSDPLCMNLEHIKRSINSDLKKIMIKYINTSQNTVNGNDSFFTSQSFDQVMATGMLKLVPDYLIKEKFRKVNKQIYTELINTLYYWNEKSHGVNFDIILRTTKESPQSDFFYVDPIRDTDITYFLNKNIINYPNLFINFSDIPKTVNQLKNKIKTLLSNDNSKNYGMFSIECPKMPRLFRDKDYTEAASNGIEDFNKLIKDLKKNRFNMINLKYMEVVCWD